MKTIIHWLDQQTVRKQLDIMPTYHYVENQGKLIMQSRENDQKFQLGQFFDHFEVKYFQCWYFFLSLTFQCVLIVLFVFLVHFSLKIVLESREPSGYLSNILISCSFPTTAMNQILAKLMYLWLTFFQSHICYGSLIEKKHCFLYSKP